MDNKIRLNKLFNIEKMSWDDIKNTTFVGIDFGTSTSVVSVATFSPQTGEIKSKSLLLPQKDEFGGNMESELFPSVIAINTVNGKPLYGQGAYSHKWDPDFTFGVNIWHSFKMELGKDLGPRWYDSQQSEIKSPLDATTKFFKFLKRSIGKAVNEYNLPKDIKYAVSIPASFESNQRKNLLEALAANGITIESSLLIDEPNAAFLGYLCNQETTAIELDNNYNPKVLVFDFGAGTCDISLLEISVDHHGLHSKNLSISQFAELGGNDIDRYIAYNYLLPQLLEKNKIDGKDRYLTKKQKDAVAEQLYGIAENIKIQLCKEDFGYLLSDKKEMDEMIASGHGIMFETPKLSIPSDYGNLTIDKFWVSYYDFLNTMEVFFAKSFLASCFIKEGQKQYNSIDTAIESSLSKAHVAKDEVNYVIMVGGSSRNPFVIRQIKHYFSEARIMLPRDTQSLVSQGAAIHSLLKHGMNIEAVRPIVGERILVVTQDGNLPIIPAGTEVPFTTKAKDILSTGDKTYREIEIPVCVGDDKKILHNLKLKRENCEAFPADTSVSLYFEMDSDKVLHVKAEALGGIWNAECKNPLDNIALTDAEAKVLKAQRNAYYSALDNDHRPTKKALIELSRAYEDNNQELMAAETLEEMLELYDDKTYFNRIGVLYHNSDNYNRAIKFFLKALEETPENPTVLSNLGHDLYCNGQYSEARKYLEKSIELRGDYPYPISKLAQLEKEEGNPDKAQELYQRAFNIFNRRWLANGLDDCDKGWFKSVARALERNEIVSQLEKELSHSSSSNGYNLDNTLFNQFFKD